MLVSCWGSCISIQRCMLEILDFLSTNSRGHFLPRKAELECPLHGALTTKTPTSFVRKSCLIQVSPQCKLMMRPSSRTKACLGHRFLRVTLSLPTWALESRDALMAKPSQNIQGHAFGLCWRRQFHMPRGLLKLQWSAAIGLGAVACLRDCEVH